MVFQSVSPDGGDNDDDDVEPGHEQWEDRS